MCTYNGALFLDEQIESILNQDYKNIELIVVDDCSTDNTWKKLEEWQQRSSVVSIYRNDINIGYNKNFEKAISLAKGDLIAISDQDDIWLPTKLCKLVLAIQDKNVLLAHSRSVRLENGRLRFKSASLHHHFEGNDTRRLFMFNQVNGHDMIFKRQLVDAFMPIPEGMMYDWWIAVTATCYGSIASVNEYLVHHRIHAHNSFFTKKVEGRKKESDLEEALQLFTKMDGLNKESRSFLYRLLNLLSDHNKKETVTFSYPFFKFLFRYRKIIFGHKRRLFPEWSYLKYAIRYAKTNYVGKGLSI